jgi:hypothetical protein
MLLGLPPTSSVAAQVPAPALRSQSSTDWPTGGSRKTHNGVLLPSTGSGQDWDEGETQKITISNKLSMR